MTASEFWEWFRANEHKIWRLKGGQSPVLDELQDVLTQHADGLYVEVSDVDDGVRELIISAAGDRSLFRSAQALVAAAPVMQRWRVAALKPARGFGFVLDADGLRLDPETIRFRALTNSADPTALGLRILVPVDKIDEGVQSAVRTLLDTGLGERMAANLAHVEVEPMPVDHKDLLSLSELGDYVEWFREKHFQGKRDLH